MARSSVAPPAASAGAEFAGMAGARGSRRSPVDTSAAGESVLRVRVIFWSLGAGLGLVQAWRARFSLNPDGIAYLDLADAWRSGEWREAVSLYWSPFYSWLLGIAMLARPSAYWEFPLVHLVGFLVFIAAFASFEFLLGGVVVAVYGRPAGGPSGEEARPLPEWALRVWAYTLFLVASLDFVSVGLATPDMSVTACMYLAVGVLARIAAGDDRVRLYVLLGTILGVGYLVKAVMLPVAAIVICATLAARDFRTAAARIVVCAAVAAILVVPFATALSLKHGGLTLGESGRMNYAWLVSRVPFPFDQRGVPTVALRGGMGWPEEALHPPRILLDRPLVLEFGSPVRGTIPLIYDMNHWYAGISVPFSLTAQIRAMLISGRELAGVLGRLAWPLAALLVLATLGARGRRWSRLPLAGAVLGVAIGALAIYGAVWVEPRYVASFVVLLGMGAVIGVRVPLGATAGRLARNVTLGVAVLTIGPQILSAANVVVAEIRSARDRAVRHVEWRTARDLHELGVRPGDEVAAIGKFETFAWARLARVRIVAGINTDSLVYWESDPLVRARANRALARAGAKVIVASRPPGALIERDQWTAVGAGAYYLHTFTEAERRREDAAHGNPERAAGLMLRRVGTGIVNDPVASRLSCAVGRA